MVLSMFVPTPKQLAEIPDEEWQRVHGCAIGSERHKLLVEGYLHDYKANLVFLEELARTFPDNEGIRQTLEEWRVGS